MNKENALSLSNKALEIARMYSQPREHNPHHEIFTLRKIVPLSDASAVACYEKSTGKFAVAFLFFVNMNGGQWHYFFPTDSHILGMQLFAQYKEKIEQANFPKNFQ